MRWWCHWWLDEEFREVPSNAISQIDTVISETTDLRQKLADHNQRLAFLEGPRRPPIASKHTSLPPAHLPEDIARRLTNAENGTNDMEFLLSETGREVNGVKHKVKYYNGSKIIWQCHNLVYIMIFHVSTYEKVSIDRFIDWQVGKQIDRQTTNSLIDWVTDSLVGRSFGRSMDGSTDSTHGRFDVWIN